MKTIKQQLRVQTQVRAGDCQSDCARNYWQSVFKQCMPLPLDQRKSCSESDALLGVHKTCRQNCPPRELDLNPSDD